MHGQDSNPWGRKQARESNLPRRVTPPDSDRVEHVLGDQEAGDPGARIRMSEQDDLIQEFLVESYENLDRLDSELVTLEESPDDKETLSSIFRTIHTIKGTSN